MNKIILVFLTLLLFVMGALSWKKVEIVRDYVDELSFSWFGGTLFGDPLQVTTKQLHFDTGELFGRDVILEGEIVERGEASTHFLMRDNEGRVLVVLTSNDFGYRLLEKSSIRQIRVLGRLERGKKGLPYLMGKVLRPSVIN